jgi:hypothetical protein
MRLRAPNVFEITVAALDTYAVVNELGGNTFISPATARWPKLYVFADGKKLLYIGQTVQSMSARMRLGFQADGTGGYYGYRWRHTLRVAQCHVWCLDDVPEEEESHALECIESEVVFGYRAKFNQWPIFQTEIHFHASTDEHRALAHQILDRFSGGAA